MTAALALKLYVLSNLLLFLTYLIFEGLRSMTQAVKLRVSHRHWIVVAQILIALSILAPLALHAVPDRHLPTIDWTAFRPVSEGESLLSRQKQPKIARNAHPKSSESPQTIADASAVERMIHWFSSRDRSAAAESALIFLILGLAFSLTRLLRNIRGLRATIRKASSIRRLGRVQVVVSDLIHVVMNQKVGCTFRQPVSGCSRWGVFLEPIQPAAEWGRVEASRGISGAGGPGQCL
jgi:hypothetical protein